MRNIKSFVRTGEAAGAPTVSFDTFFSSFHFEKNTQDDSGQHAAAFTYNYVKPHPEQPSPHDLSASHSEAARSECVVLDKATQHDLLSSGGERAWKMASDVVAMYINGQGTNYAELVKTLYVNPYMVVTDQEYSKHYYIEGERVCTKIGGGFGPGPNIPFEGGLPLIQDDYETVRNELWEMTLRFRECTQGPDITINENLEPGHNGEDYFEELQYFYHPDHLGSSSFITDAMGYATQHLQYLPFGETFVDQQNGYDSRYTFSAKEKDDETQYSYFGARYYDSDLSVWLSVDPLSDKYPSVSPFMYAIGNPVKYIDPDGKDIAVGLAWATTSQPEQSGHMVMYVTTYVAVEVKVNENNKVVTKTLYKATGTAKIENWPTDDQHKSATRVNEKDGGKSMDNNTSLYKINTDEGIVALDGQTYYSEQETRGERSILADANSRQGNPDLGYSHGTSYLDQNDCSSIIIDLLVDNGVLSDRKLGVTTADGHSFYTPNAIAIGLKKAGSKEFVISQEDAKNITLQNAKDYLKIQIQNEKQ